MDSTTWIMILKMSGMTALYVGLTMLLWERNRGRTIGRGESVGIGLFYSALAILSTHFGVDYGHMLLNVRDMAPLAAGVFFHPLSGVIAGLIGGVERYLVGTFWDIGSYTRFACSVSTCLAGLLSMFLYYVVFRRKKPTGGYAFFVGALMEVFHMYFVFITHRKDIMTAYYVVSTSALPMILFNGFGLAACAILMQVATGEWRNPLKRRPKGETPLAQRFQRWLFVVTLAVLLVNYFIAYAVQTQIAFVNAKNTLNDIAEDISNTYYKVQSIMQSVMDYAEELALSDAQVITRALERADVVPREDMLERLREFYNLESIVVLSPKGNVLQRAGKAPALASMFEDVLSGRVKQQTRALSMHRVAAGVAFADGMVQVTVNPSMLAETMNLAGINDTLSYFHVGQDGSFDIIQKSGLIIAGTHELGTLSITDSVALHRQAEGEVFTETLFRKKAYCRVDKLYDGAMLLTMLPVSEVFAYRNSQVYETALADILLFATIHMLVSVLVQMVVVNNLNLVNASLSRITNGDLDEVVNVRKSSEFSSLSDDINRTVDALKGYISAAEHRMEQELQFAATIQDSSLPRNFTFPRSDFELFALMDPAKEVGGDFYDFFFVDGGRLALVIADVSGKGIPAALFMMRSKTAIRGLAESGNAPSEIFQKANIVLCEGNDAEMFVTAWIGIIDLDTGRMTCASAGHEYPILKRANGDYALMKDRHGLALAAMEGVRYRDYEIQLNPGDRLFVYTDGVPEAINETMTQYGCERLVGRLNADRSARMRDLLPAVRADIREFVGGAEQFDDITMLGFAYFGAQNRH